MFQAHDIHLIIIKSMHYDNENQTLAFHLQNEV